VLHSLILQIIAGIVGLWAATRFVGGVEFTGPLTTLLIAGTALGAINTFIKPIVKLVTLPLRLLTFGLFGIVINMVMVWIVDILFPELIVTGLIPLFWTSIAIWILSAAVSLFGKGKLDF